MNFVFDHFGLLRDLALALFALFVGGQTWFRSRSRIAWKRRRQIRRVRNAAGAVTSIAGAPDGLCRVRGRVKVLRGAEGYPELGAYLAWSSGRVQTLQRNKHNQPVMARTFAKRSGCGRFVVQDESGAALVDAPSVFDVWSEKIGLRLVHSGALEARDGVEVELIGVAHSAPLPPDAAALSGGQPQTGGLGLVFEGTREQPLWILLPAN